MVKSHAIRSIYIGFVNNISVPYTLNQAKGYYKECMEVILDKKINLSVRIPCNANRNDPRTDCEEYIELINYCTDPIKIELSVLKNHKRPINNTLQIGKIIRRG